MKIIYSTFSIGQKLQIWIWRLASIAFLIFVTYHISERPFLIGIIASILISFIIIINEEKIIVFENQFILRKYYLLNLYGIDKATFSFKDLLRLETDDRTLLDEIVSRFRNMGGSNLYIYFKNETHKTLNTSINYSEICEIVQIVNEKIALNVKD